MRVLATYTLQVVAPGSEVAPEPDKRMLSNLPAMLEAVEEDLTDLLPEGYRAELKEWNDDR